MSEENRKEKDPLVVRVGKKSQFLNTAAWIIIVVFVVIALVAD